MQRQQRFFWKNFSIGLTPLTLKPPGCMCLLLNNSLKNKRRKYYQVVAVGKYKRKSYHCIDGDGCSSSFYVWKHSDNITRIEFTVKLMKLGFLHLNFYIRNLYSCIEKNPLSHINFRPQKPLIHSWYKSSEFKFKRGVHHLQDSQSQFLG